MYQTYEGQIQNGRPIILEQVSLPENARFVITILDSKFFRSNEVIDTYQEQQKKAAYDFIEAIKDTEGELTNDDFVEFESGKYKVKIGLKELDL